MSTETVAALDTPAVIPDPTAVQTVVRGTFTLYMTKSYVDQALPKGVVITPINAWLHSVVDDWTSTTYQVVGGNIDLRTGAGYLQMDGGTVVSSIKTGMCMTLFDIRFDLLTHTIDYTWKTGNGDAPVRGLTVAGPGQGGVWGKSGSYTAEAVYVKREAAAVMNEVLQTEAFLDEGLFGAVAAQFELADAAPTDGIVHWGLKV